MEQRIEPIIQLENVAGTDPAYVPGITPQESAEEAEREERTEGRDGDEAAAAAEKSAGAEEPSGEEPAEGRSGGTDAGADTDTAGAGEPEAADTADGTGDDTGEETAADDAGGPSFEVIDPLGAISAGRDGVTLRMDGEEVELDWEEIGAVEVTPPRIGRRFTVTFYTVDGPWFRGEVHAPTKEHLKKWDAELDEVLDAYFEG
ncbi:hypothetical protein V1L54_18215 [Streptomyces sp. TRM 70361]|uniref:hypothetical protein n=1 Tax=Streptomyces sp. TRM 70361 TaxID=3116553 RepID=UPI002E7B6D46|nr:hypothetical protein [Streptomyces sp. TRM 70361]MEE1941319.1 hypothetical protein [Streptomyces sp. TRM 70361]